MMLLGVAQDRSCRKGCVGVVEIGVCMNSEGAGWRGGAGPLGDVGLV